MKLLAIDPGNILSGYIIAECDDGRMAKILEAGKIDNNELMQVIAENKCDIAIELIESFGMAVGKTVFDTCIWTGRFVQYALDTHGDITYSYVTRREEKLCLCGSPKAKDANIRQALIDLYAEHDFRFGRGTKKDPDFFHGVKADAWSACAVAQTFLQREE